LSIWQAFGSFGGQTGIGMFCGAALNSIELDPAPGLECNDNMNPPANSTTARLRNATFITLYPPASISLRLFRTLKEEEARPRNKKAFNLQIGLPK
jgi:hypothetical protein